MILKEIEVIPMERFLKDTLVIQSKSLEEPGICYAQIYPFGPSGFLEGPKG
jgi:hypothetical protein